MGSLVAIASREKVRTPMVEVRQAEVSLETGVARDARGKPGDRQVTVVSREAWQRACQALGETVPWTLRRANLLVEGVELAETIGRRIRIGPVVLEVTEETEPCENMDRQHPGLRKALEPEWRGGVTCRIVEPGSISIGDPVALE